MNFVKQLMFSINFYEIHTQSLKPDNVTLEKAVELLSGKNVTQSGRPKKKPKFEEAVEAM